MLGLTDAEEYALMAARHLWYDGEDPRAALGRRAFGDALDRALSHLWDDWWNLDIEHIQVAPLPSSWIGPSSPAPPFREGAD